MKKKYDYIVVGSGCGGATIARELTKAGKSVLILERGKYFKKVGGVASVIKYLQQEKSTDGVDIQRAFMAGGTAVLSCGSGGRCLERQLSKIGIDLTEEFSEAEEDLHISPVIDEFLTDGAHSLMKAADELGIDMTPMPKLVKYEKCNGCAQCAFGCTQNAKWTPLKYLDEAVKLGADAEYKAEVTEVIHKDGSAIGVKYKQGFRKSEVFADNIIIAAGALATPIILQNSGLKDAGKNLSIDPAVNVYGVTDGLSTRREPQMSTLVTQFHDTDGYILSPYINTVPMGRRVTLGYRDASRFKTRDMLGLMVKVKDESVGEVKNNGKIIKKMTEADQERINKGVEMAKRILEKAGAEKGSFAVSRINAGHPAGTAAIGQIVDKNLETRIKGLYVCDASVLPEAPGKPPIVTIVAIAKRLAKILTSE